MIHYPSLVYIYEPLKDVGCSYIGNMTTGPVGIGLLALRTDILFTPAPERDRSFYLSNMTTYAYL